MGTFTLIPLWYRDRVDLCSPRSGIGIWGTKIRRIDYTILRSQFYYLQRGTKSVAPIPCSMAQINVRQF
jgi:hypothetical protein